MREQKAVAAIIQDSQGRFLVTYNANWEGYAFPMIALPEGGDILGFAGDSGGRARSRPAN